MTSVIAFFPWAFVRAPIAVGPLRLLPYEKGHLPGDQPLVSQGNIDGVLDAYADRPNVPVGRGTLLELFGWQSGMDATDEQVAQLFRARHLVGFSALAQRELFYHASYANFDTYALVIQRFEPSEPGTFSFAVRRRDGQSRHLWGTDEFAFHRPLHVDSRAEIFLDEALLLALLDVPETHEHIYEAMVEFNLANTDSSDVPDHVEVVMCKSAFEWLLQIDSNAKSFVAALEGHLSDIKLAKSVGPIATKWNSRWPKSPNLLSAWAKDFCAVRGASAHGAAKRDFVWSRRQHLVFVAIFFPLLVKKVLTDSGLLTMNEADVEKMCRIEEYLSHDPFDFNWHSGMTHPWSEIGSAARIGVLAKKLYPE
ncbi:hypothetical protein BLA18109_05106 [Burkholderia lata]|uniref:Apea-like HEPN domain-containing protein n=2 Tax=Burkholderia lata (strain ATCC 17760 / DSM 23089 / LMG 22485 / NCIMB 9086 / R18194 / 383) TaxID=482957 RepID=A0A6P2XHP1_BURL3|nr:hypothetical protein BLA18109_05106 [Burkholderia lata]